ncbi:abortive infection system antitoxin AbiGi family protein [Vibrio sp. Vb1018]|uniref:abortive infection system antitoxin AbiGi family protein n=1 Tax=Vibrio sp. Vb1018 TaxID=3074636 RepID=UPI00296553D1|nr:abortive infection system antitoxin AbiGi family protein [Vibrio sp. Vb1018]MDW1822408.1 abortive infection system antitoxin AbiGi family protein [Vibrio sp. Vb1018]
MKSKSASLFHFTPKMEYLISILKNGFYPRFCLEDSRLMDWYAQDYLAFPMVCFCDIPLSKISEHTDFYGSYGIGLKRNWGNECGLSPVIYASPKSQIVELASSLAHRMLILEPQSEQAEEDAKNLLSLLKPVSGTMLIDGKNESRDFYQENEWRFVPKSRNAIPSSQFEQKRGHANEMMLEHKLSFELSDIQYIFVKCESEIPELAEFIAEEFLSEGRASISVLISKIVALDTLIPDV